MSWNSILCYVMACFDERENNDFYEIIMYAMGF